MIDHKREFVLLLEEKTTKGVIPWESTARNHCFRSVLTEKYYVEVEESSDYVDTKSYIVRIVSARGTDVDEIKAAGVDLINAKHLLSC